MTRLPAPIHPLSCRVHPLRPKPLMDVGRDGWRFVRPEEVVRATGICKVMTAHVRTQADGEAAVQLLEVGVRRSGVPALPLGAHSLLGEGPHHWQPDD